MDEHQRLHDDEIPIDDELVSQLVQSQFPQWATLPLRRIRSTGTVNAIFRLGDDIALRLPRTPSFAPTIDAIEASRVWLDWVRTRLPLRVPEAIAIGEPSERYPWPWQVHRWIDGDSLGVVDLSDSVATAERLGAFVKDLHSLPVSAGEARRSVKAIGRAECDPVFRDVLATLSDIVDTSAVLAVWDKTMEAPAWDKAGVWVHGDLLPDNLLASDGALNAVIDFECYGTGDPALDLTPAWTIFSPRARAAFRATVEPDAATWERARNHALRAVNGISYYEHTNPTFARMCLRTLNEAVADVAR